MADDWKQVKMTYSIKKNEITIYANESDFVPKYLDYLLEYYGIPKNAKRRFEGRKET